MSVKLLNEHNLEFLSLKEGCSGLSEFTLVQCQIVGNHMSRLKFIIILLFCSTRYLIVMPLTYMTCTLGRVGELTVGLSLFNRT